MQAFIRLSQDFLTLRRILLVIAGMADSIGFLPPFKNDLAVIVLVLLLTVDDAVADKCAVNFGKRDFNICNVANLGGGEQCEQAHARTCTRFRD